MSAGTAALARTITALALRPLAGLRLAAALAATLALALALEAYDIEDPPPKALEALAEAVYAPFPTFPGAFRARLRRR